jgi:hypothetical protein
LILVSCRATARRRTTRRKMMECNREKNKKRRRKTVDSLHDKRNDSTSCVAFSSLVCVSRFPCLTRGVVVEFLSIRLVARSSSHEKTTKRDLHARRCSPSIERSRSALASCADGASAFVTGETKTMLCFVHRSSCDSTTSGTSDRWRRAWPRVEHQIQSVDETH